MKNSHISLTEFALRLEAKLISGVMVFSIVMSQTLFPYSALAVYDFPPALVGTPLATANASLATTLSSLDAASSTLRVMNTQLSTARAGVLTVAMNQGLTTANINLEQITDASKILPNDATALAKTMVTEAIDAGALTMQIKNGVTLGDAVAEEMATDVLRRVYDFDRAMLSDYLPPICVDPDDFSNTANGSNGPLPLTCSPTRAQMLSYIDIGKSALTSYGSALTQLTATDVLNAAYVSPDFCYWDASNMVDVCVPQPPIATVIAPAELGKIVKNTIINKLAGDLVSTIGVLDESTYKSVFSGDMIAITGLGDPVVLAATLGVPSFNKFKSSVKNAIHQEILNQVGIITSDTISPAMLESMVYDVIGDPKGTLKNAAMDAVDAALAGSGVSLTQITSMASLDRSDVQKMVLGALKDNGMLGSVTPAQLTNILNGSYTDLTSFAGVATLADMKGLLATQMSLAGLGNPAALLAQMGGGTIEGLKGAIKNAMIGNVMKDLSALQGSLDPALLKDTIASSIFGTTQIGNINDIKSIVTNLPNIDANLAKLAINIPSFALAERAINDAIGNGAVALTQLTNLSQIQTPDIERILNGVLSDNGLLASVSPAQFQDMLSGTISRFNSFDPFSTLDTINGPANIANIEIMLSEQIGSVISVDPASLVAGMSGVTLESITGSMENVMSSNVFAKLGSLNGTLDATKIEGMLSNAILNTTGVGDLTDITALVGLIPNTDVILGGLQSKAQEIIDGQMLKMSNLLDPANVEQLISAKLMTLTGFNGNINSILDKIDPNIGKAFSTISMVGGQLEGLTGSFDAAFGNATLGLNSLTSSFNGQLAGLSALAQDNLVALTSQISSITGPLVSQITGPLQNAMGSLSSVSGGIIGSGVANLGDLTSLGSLTSGSLGGVTGQFSSVLGGGGGVSSLTGFGGVASASGMAALPFGGPIVYAFPCTCGPIPGSWIVKTVNFAGGPTDFIYVPGRSILFPAYQIYRSGPMTLGLYSAVSMSCNIFVLFGCTSIGAGPTISMVGTSI
jgi:hypothetical protein